MNSSSSSSVVSQFIRGATIASGTTSSTGGNGDNMAASIKPRRGASGAGRAAAGSEDYSTATSCSTGLCTVSATSTAPRGSVHHESLIGTLRKQQQQQQQQRPSSLPLPLAKKLKSNNYPPHGHACAAAPAGPRKMAPPKRNVTKKKEVRVRNETVLLSRLREEMEILDDEETAAYREALHKVPEIVSSESDPKKYLRASGDDASRAAARLALYWKKRLALFGPDRAFLPMTQTGTGTLSEEDLEVLGTGTWVVVPKDNAGRVVFFYNEDRSTQQMKSHEARLSRFRCVFYVLHTMGENEASRTAGLVCIRTTTSNTPNFAPARLANLWSNFEALPVLLIGYYQLFVPESPGAVRMFTKTLIPTMERNLSKPLQRVTHSLVAGSLSEMNDKMRQDPVLRALDSRGLPPILGGSWSYDLFSQWQVNRFRYEKDFYEPRFFNNKNKNKNKKQAPPLVKASPKPTTTTPFKALPSCSPHGAASSAPKFTAASATPAEQPNGTPSQSAGGLAALLSAVEVATVTPSSGGRMNSSRPAETVAPHSAARSSSSQVTPSSRQKRLPHEVLQADNKLISAARAREDASELTKEHEGVSPNFGLERRQLSMSVHPRLTTVCASASFDQNDDRDKLMARPPPHQTSAAAAVARAEPRFNEPKSVVSALRRAQNPCAPPPPTTAVAVAADGDSCSPATANPVIAALRQSKVVAHLQHQKQERPQTTTAPRPETTAAAAVVAPSGNCCSGSGSGSASWVEEKIKQERQLQQVLAAIVSKGAAAGPADQQVKVEFPAADRGRQPVAPLAAAATATAAAVGQSAPSSGLNSAPLEQVLRQQVSASNNSALASIIAAWRVGSGSAYNGRVQGLVQGRPLESSQLLQQLQQQPAAARPTSTSTQSQLLDLIALSGGGSVVSASNHRPRSNSSSSSSSLIERLLVERIRTEENLRKGKQQQQQLLLLLQDALRPQQQHQRTGRHSSQNEQNNNVHLVNQLLQQQQQRQQHQQHHQT